MSLLDRLIGTESPKVPIHAFMAALAEYKRGAVTQAQIVSGFGLNATEELHLQEFLANLDLSTIDRSIIHDTLILAEGGYYPKATVKTRLGIVSG